MSECTIECVQLFAGLGNTVLAALALLLAVCVAAVRWKDVFRSNLRKRQFEELAAVRRDLHNIWVELYYLPYTRDMMETSSWNVNDLREQAPHQWESYMRYSSCSRNLFYKLQSPNYFLFPRWMDKKHLAAFRSTMSTFDPFTLMSSTTPDDATRSQYMDAILTFIDYLDQQLQKRY